MQTIGRDRYGSPDVLRLDEVPDPVPGPGDVLVRVRAASVNRADLDYLTGRPVITRGLLGFRAPRIGSLGLDAAGEVVACGAGVAGFRPGDRVFANLTEHGHGAFAELACAPEAAWRPIPDGVSFEVAATLPESAVLAYQGLGMGRQRGVAPGHAVLVNGASGSVGQFAVQLARRVGATVTGVCSAGKADLVLGLGAIRAIDYATTDWTRSGDRFDWIVDVVGDRSVFDVRRALAPGGTYVSLGARSTGRILHTMLVGPLLSIGRRRSMGVLLAWKVNDARDLAALGAMVQAGTLAPVIDRTYSLADVPAALRRAGAGEARGKLVIVM